MTLVVGYADNEIGFLVGDTLLSYPVEQHNPREPFIEKFHALKIQILNPDVAVSFAGEANLSLTILKQLRTELHTTSQLDVPHRLLELYQECITQQGFPQDSCEFLILLITPENTKKLILIRDGCIDYVQRAYIGDSVEYANFKTFIEPYNGPKTCRVLNSDGSWDSQLVTEGEQEFSQASNALEKLTHQRRSETVGAICGCVTRVVDARISKKLEYMQSVEASVSPAEGHAGFSVLASNVGATLGIGLYYRGWQAGLIFIAGDLVSCRKLAAKTIDEFIAVAHAQYGLNLEGGKW